MIMSKKYPVLEPDIGLFQQRIAHCTKCSLHKVRRELALGEGSIPADIVLVGEGPGRNEDIVGRVFIGRSGQLLRKTLKWIQWTMLTNQSTPTSVLLAFVLQAHLEYDQELSDRDYSLICQRTFSWYLLNLVCCHPTDERAGEDRKPTSEEVGACRPRFAEHISIVNPKVIVALGRVPERYLKKPYPNMQHATHPAGILRQGGASMRGAVYVAWKRRLEEIIIKGISA